VTASVPGFEVTAIVGGADNVFYFVATATAASGGSAGGTGGIAVGDQQVFTVDFTPPVAGGADKPITPVLAIPNTFRNGAAQIDHVAVSATGELVLAGTFSGTLDLGQGVTLQAGGGGGVGNNVSETFIAFFGGPGAGTVSAAPIGKKGGAMSVDRVSFTGEGEIIVAGTFAGKASLGLSQTALGPQDAFIAFFGSDLTLARSGVVGAVGESATLASDWLVGEGGGGCAATGDLVGVAVRLGDEVVVAGVGDNGKCCQSDGRPAGEGKTEILDLPGGDFHVSLPAGERVAYDTVTAGGSAGPMSYWPPVPDPDATAGRSKVRSLNNAR